MNDMYEDRDYEVLSLSDFEYELLKVLKEISFNLYQMRDK
jgi:hypothetical protein